MNLIQKYKDLLLSAGFSEAKKVELRFFRETNNYVAFIVDIVSNDGIEIYYGFASTAFTRIKGAEADLINFGVNKDDITLRQKTTITTEEDEPRVAQVIYEYYQKYCSATKEELLMLASEKRKEFISIITRRLKALGFKKKNHTWTYALDGKHYVSFNAQKSAYSDGYYFNIYIGLFKTKDYGDCFYKRVSMEGDMTDWQLVTEQDFTLWLNSVIETILLRVIRTPLDELGKEKDIWLGCLCNREKCESCWVKKNLWEANADA